MRSEVDTLGPVPVAATNISRTVFNPANVTQGEEMRQSIVDSSYTAPVQATY